MAPSGTLNNDRFFEIDHLTSVNKLRPKKTKKNVVRAFFCQTDLDPPPPPPPPPPLTKIPGSAHGERARERER